MVVFTCINCGESVKKTSVAKHYMGRCRGPPNVTCVDCLKDFRGNEYEAHTKCMTEEERYSAKGFVPKATSNKGEKKQQSWCEAIQSILNTNTIQNDERKLLTLLSNHENVPRKRGKFLNFVANAHRAMAKNNDLVERVWNIIESTGKQANAATQQTSPENTTENGGKEEETAPSEDKGKKRKKHSEEPTEETNGVSEDSSKAKKKKKQNKNNEGATNGHSNATDEGGQTTAETPIDLLKKLISSTGGNTNLYKLQQSLSEYCVNDSGFDKAEKRLKKIQKGIKVTLKNDNVCLL